jgi:hypothetical protein
MQTFLPYPVFAASVGCLDRARLGKQRVEALQILNALEGRSRGWVNHPATRMWRGYAPALRCYLRHCIVEWVARGYKNTMAMPPLEEHAQMPPWLGDPALHASHRSNLLRKDPAWYGRFGWSEQPDLPYVWHAPKEATP